MPAIRIANRQIGAGQPCFVIAEAGVNHNGDVNLAHKLIDAAVNAHADAVKFQTFRAELLVSPLAQKAPYQKATTGNEENQLEMLKRLELSREQYSELQRHCEDVGIIFLSTAFEQESADLLDSMGVPAFKIPSGEITNLPFLRYLAQKGRPMILSTGMANLAEVDRAVATLADRELALLHCTSAYPADPAHCNLRAMNTLSTAFGMPIGLSDHTEGIAVPIAAVALGATIVEKHFTLDRSMPGPDHKASLAPADLAAMIAGIRTAEAALGDGIKRPHPVEAAVAKVARKSIVVTQDLAEGTVLHHAVLAVRRPGTGIPPEFWERIAGRELRCAAAAGTPLQWDMLK